MRQPKVAKAGKRSPAQVAATARFAAAGRAAQASARATFMKAHPGKKPPVSKARHQAALKWAAAGRAAQAAKKQGKVAAKPAAAVAPAGAAALPGGWALGCNDVAPTCAAAAVANCLLAATGLEALKEDIALLHALAAGDDGGAQACDVLDALRMFPFAFPARLAAFRRVDHESGLPGLVVVTSFTHERHAVLSHPDGMVSWGRVMPWRGIPEEAWALEWAVS